VGFFVVAMILAALKVLVATSYSRTSSGLLPHAPGIRFDGADDNRNAYVKLPISVKNCTGVFSTGVNGMTVEHQSADAGECEAVVDCEMQCTLHTPEALETLCSMYILAAFYIAYLGYELHRSLCIDRITFSLSGRFARIAQSLTPLLRFLPDVAALMKYGLVALTIGVTLTQDAMVSCKDLPDQTQAAKISGTDMKDGCNPSVEPFLSGRRDAMMSLFGIEAILFAAAIVIKQRMLWPSYAGRIVGGFMVSQVVMLGLQLFFVGELASLNSLHGLPSFGCRDNTIYSTAHDVHPFLTSGHAAAWEAAKLPACPVNPTLKPTPTPPIPPKPTPPITPKPTPPITPKPTPPMTPKPTPPMTPKPTPPLTPKPTSSPTISPAAGTSWACFGHGAQTALNVTVVKHSTPAPQAIEVGTWAELRSGVVSFGFSRLQTIKCLNFIML
jgi:outer membrane biosynthesis protein TonB